MRVARVVMPLALIVASLVTAASVSALPNLRADVELPPQVEGRFVYYAEASRMQSRPVRVMRLDLETMGSQVVYTPTNGLIARFKAENGWLAVVVRNGTSESTYRVAPDGSVAGPLAGDAFKYGRCGSGVKPLAVEQDGGVVVLRIEWNCDWAVPSVEKVIAYRATGERTEIQVYTGQDNDLPQVTGRLVGQKLLLVSNDLLLVDLASGTRQRVWRNNADDGALTPAGGVWVSTVGANNGGRYWSALLSGQAPFSEYNAVKTTVTSWRKARHSAIVPCGDRLLVAHGRLSADDIERGELGIRTRAGLYRLAGRIGFDVYEPDGRLVKSIPSRKSRGGMTFGCTSDALTIVEIGRRKSRVARIGL